VRGTLSTCQADFVVVLAPFALRNRFLTIAREISASDVPRHDA